MLKDAGEGGPRGNGAGNGRGNGMEKIDPGVEVTLNPPGNGKSIAVDGEDSGTDSETTSDDEDESEVTEDYDSEDIDTDDMSSTDSGEEVDTTVFVPQIKGEVLAQVESSNHTCQTAHVRNKA